MTSDLDLIRAQFRAAAALEMLIESGINEDQRKALDAICDAFILMGRRLGDINAAARSVKH